MPIDPSNYDACLAKIAAKGTISSREAQNILQAVSDHADQLTGGTDRFITAAKELGDNIRATARANRLDAFRNAGIAKQITDRIRTEGGIDVAKRVLQSVLHWMPGANYLTSIEGMWRANAKQWIGTVGNQVRQAGLKDAALSKELDPGLADEMWARRHLGPEPTGPMNAARQLASILMPAVDHMVDRLNAVGARIGKAIDYVAHTSHDPRRMRAAAGPGTTLDEAFAQWWKDIRPWTNEDIFDDLVPGAGRPAYLGETREEAIERFARSFYDATISGIHKTAPGMSGMAADEGGFVPPAYEGTRNIARSLSQPRVWRFKDAASWLAYSDKYGAGTSIYAQTILALDHGARQLALMKGLGTNPGAALNRIIRRVQEEYRTNLEGLAAFNNATHGLQNVLGRLDGTLNVPAHADWSQFVDHVMSAEAAAHLGGVALTHFAAAPFTLSAELAHHGFIGAGRLTAIGNALKAAASGRGSAELQEILADAGAYAHGYNLDIQTKWNNQAGVPGALSWAMGNFMRLTGLPRLLDQFQAKGIKGLLMHSLGREADKTFDAINPARRALLQRYRIGSDEWDLLRSGTLPTAEGRRYITPSQAADADPAKVEQLLRDRGVLNDKSTPDAVDREVKRFQWDLSDRYLMYLNDASEHATVTPGVRERALIYGSNRPGTLGWTIARVMSQFKMWPIAAVNQVIGREIGYSMSKLQMASNLGWAFGLATLGGALRMSVNDIAAGRPQRDYMNPMTLLAAFAQGGGAGIYGDFLFGETSRMGAGFASTAGGPIVADFDRLLRMEQRWREDVRLHTGKAMQHLWPDLAHWSVGHVPFANLVYLKGALDYLLWYHLYEAASPGWWDRTNQRLLKEQGRAMIGYQPGGRIPWTPWGIGGGAQQ